MKQSNAAVIKSMKKASTVQKHNVRLEASSQLDLDNLKDKCRKRCIDLDHDFVLFMATIVSTKIVSLTDSVRRQKILIKLIIINVTSVVIFKNN